jgi:hypothetical protein
MRIDFALTDDAGNKYEGTAELGLPCENAAPGRADGQATTDPKGLPDHILGLRNRGFFKEPRIPAEVYDQLQPTYRCEFERVKVALLRLQRRRELRKASRGVAGQERVAYVW